MQKFKKFTPYIVAIVSFIMVSMIYFAPQYAEKDVRKSDDVQSKGMTGGLTEHIDTYDEHPQWLPNMFSGMPAYLTHMNYDGRYIKELSGYLYFLGTPTAYYFLLMLGFFFMLLCFKVKPYVAIVGSIAYGLSSYFVIIYEAGHITKLMALIYIAPLIGSIYLTYRKNLLLGAALAGIFTAIEISCSHPQITYYFLFVIFALFIFEAINHFKEKKLAQFWVRSGVLVIVAMLGIGANIVQLWYINDYASESIRGGSELKMTDNAQNQTSGLDKDYIVNWSYGKMETLNLFIPNLTGGGSSGGFSEDGEVAQSLAKYQAKDMATQLPAYWGPQPFTSGPVYIGAVMIFLFILGIFIVKGWLRWWLIAVTIFSVFLAWGKNMMWLTDLFIDYMPLYNKFRTVSMILVIAQWSIPLLGMLALQKVYTASISKEDFTKALKRTLYITVSITLIFIVAGGAFFDFSSASDGGMGLPADVITAMEQERVSLLRADAFRSLIFVLLAAIATWFIYDNRYNKRNFVTAALALLVIIDMVGIDTRYLNYDDFVSKVKSKEIVATAVDKQIMRDTDPNYRVANLTVSPFNDALTSYFHKSVGGYHAAKLRRYQDIIDRYLSKMDMSVYNMLNTKYFITANKDKKQSVQINPEAFGHAWFIDTVTYADGADSELALVGEVDLKSSAVVDSRFKSNLENIILSNNIDSTRAVELTSYKVNHLSYNVKNSNSSVVVFPEVYYSKGWTAFVDGAEYPYFRANYILRAIALPEGEHTVEFKFEAPNFKLLYGITAGSSIILLLMFGGALIISIKKRKDSEQNKI